LLVGVVPFGLVFGAAAADADLGHLEVAAFSIGIFAGASQLAALDLLADGAAVAVAAGTALIINSRMLLYSAGLVPWFAHLPRRRRAAAAYLLTDQAFAVSIAHFDITEPAPEHRLSYYVGSGLTLWITWQITTQLGVLLSNAVPEDQNVEIAVPLLFLTLLIPSIRDRPTLAAAVVSGVVAVLAAPLPANTGMPLAALAGITAGVVLATRQAEPT
jgi:predicted branched-subunit amino acid permease